MNQHDKIRAILPDFINGKTHEELQNETLVTERNTASYRVDGIRFPWNVPRSNVDALQTFTVRDDDIFMITYPRSGTHWIAEIMHFIVSDGMEDFPRTFMKTSLESTKASHPSLLDSTTPGHKIFASMRSPRCICTHCPERFLPPQVWTKQAKVVYVARNPKDVLVSLFELVKSLVPASMFQNFDEFLWQFYFGEMVFGSWFDHVLDYWKHKNDANVIFLKYEDLQKDLRGSIHRLAKHVEKDLCDDVIDSITEHVTFTGMQSTYEKLANVYGEKAKEMTHCYGNEAAPYLRKGKVGGWKDTFTVAQNTIFDKVYALKLEGSGLEFDFDP